MRILVLGGTKFVGRHIVEQALDEGHDVVLFNRGVTDPGLFPDVEQVHGDRDDLTALPKGTFDVVIDTSGYVPKVVRKASSALSDRVERYVFISSISVYADFSRPGLDEAAPLAVLDDAGSEDIDRDYGPLKAACERAVEEDVPGRSLMIRPGLIVGPHDPTNRFTYWVTRMARGGEVLAPDALEQQVQFIDARDLANWVLYMATDRATGIYNAVGPASALSLGDLLDACEAEGGARVTRRVVDPHFLIANGVEPWMGLPLWLGTDPELAGLTRVDNSKATGAGLRFRDPAETIRDTHMWARGIERPPGDAGLDPERERELLEAYRALRA